jgi:hypothetical protein
LKVLGKDTDFLYDTIEKYIKDAETANKPELVKIWQTIKEDRKRHLHLLKEAVLGHCTSQWNFCDIIFIIAV